MGETNALANPTWKGPTKLLTYCNSGLGKLVRPGGEESARFSGQGNATVSMLRSGLGGIHRAVQPDAGSTYGYEGYPFF